MKRGRRQRTCLQGVNADRRASVAETGNPERGNIVNYPFQWSCTDMIDQEPKLIYKYP